MIFLIIVFGVAFVVLAAALGIWWAAASNAEREFEQSVQAWHRAGGGDIVTAFRRDIYIRAGLRPRLPPPGTEPASQDATRAS